MLQTYIACHINTVCMLFFVSTNMLEFISKIHIVIQYMKKGVFSVRPNTHNYVLSNHITRLLNLSSVIIKELKSWLLFFACDKNTKHVDL